MGENTKIEWATHTFNAWLGCTKISVACDNCYAESWAKRTGGAALWQGDRRRTSVANWKQPIKWNREAPTDVSRWQDRPRVFCSSLADVFDNQVPGEWRADLWALIRDTPNLEWLLLTKRPQNIVKMVKAIGFMPANIAFGTTVEDRKAVEQRLPHMMVAAGLRPRFLFTSCEPLLGDLGDLSPWMTGDPFPQHLAEGERFERGFKLDRDGVPKLPAIAWWIGGGESGPHARPMHPAWERSIRRQCAASGVAYLGKQWGEWAPGGEWYEHHPVSLEVRGWTGSCWTDDPSGWGDADNYMVRLGKKRAGRLLDGVEHNGFPEVPA
ncbi:phage Gp37/Gp68 family protein [Labrys neptuniae]